MYALWTFYSVPQVVKGLGPDHRGAVRAILVGLGINGALTAFVALIALGISTRGYGGRDHRDLSTHGVMGWHSRFALHHGRPGDQLLVGVTRSRRHPTGKDRHLGQVSLAVRYTPIASDFVGRSVAVPRVSAPGRRCNCNRCRPDHHPHVLAGQANRTGARPRLDTRPLGTSGYARSRTALTGLDGRRFPGLCTIAGANGVICVGKQVIVRPAIQQMQTAEAEFFIAVSHTI